jgi:hypothetical protein
MYTDRAHKASNIKEGIINLPMQNRELKAHQCQADLGTWSDLFSDGQNRRKLYGYSFRYPISENKAQKAALLQVLKRGINATSIDIAYRDDLY